MKKLLVFTIWQVTDSTDLTESSNLWYLRYYERYFDEVVHIFLSGNRTEKKVTFGRTSYVSLGTGNNKLDLLLSPIRLLKFARSYKPTAYSTCEQVWFVWVTFLIKIFSSEKIDMTPITYPEAMYKTTGKSLSTILPIWLERPLIKLGYRFADRVITAKGFGSYVEWLSDIPVVRKKLLIADPIPESIPTQAFFKTLNEFEADNVVSDGFCRLVYVGRLHKEKIVDHLLRMLAILKKRGVSAKLKLIGDGDERGNLEKMVSELGLNDLVDFLGWTPNSDLPKYFKSSDIFVSPSTGGALREAALCGLPVVAYNSDWITGLLKDKETFLAVEPGDYSAMADGVEALISDDELRSSLSENVRKLAEELWSDTGIDESLRQIYG